MKGIGTLYVPQRYGTIAMGNLVQDICHQSGYIPYLKKFAEQLETEEGRNRQ